MASNGHGGAGRASGAIAEACRDFTTEEQANSECTRLYHPFKLLQVLHACKVCVRQLKAKGAGCFDACFDHPDRGTNGSPNELLVARPDLGFNAAPYGSRFGPDDDLTDEELDWVKDRKDAKSPAYACPIGAHVEGSHCVCPPGLRATDMMRCACPPDTLVYYNPDDIDDVGEDAYGTCYCPTSGAAVSEVDGTCDPTAAIPEEWAGRKVGWMFHAANLQTYAGIEDCLARGGNSLVQMLCLKMKKQKVGDPCAAGASEGDSCVWTGGELLGTFPYAGRRVPTRVRGGYSASYSCARARGAASTSPLHCMHTDTDQFAVPTSAATSLQEGDGLATLRAIRAEMKEGCEVECKAVGGRGCRLAATSPAGNPAFVCLPSTDADTEAVCHQSCPPPSLCVAEPGTNKYVCERADAVEPGAVHGESSSAGTVRTAATLRSKRRHPNTCPPVVGEVNLELGFKVQAGSLISLGSADGTWFFTDNTRALYVSVRVQGVGARVCGSRKRKKRGGLSHSLQRRLQQQQSGGEGGKKKEWASEPYFFSVFLMSLISIMLPM